MSNPPVEEKQTNEPDWIFTSKNKTKNVGNDSNSGFVSQNRNINSIIPTGPNPLDDYYNMRHENRGLALIFCHKTFYHPLNCSTRYGTEVDRDNLKRILKKLNFNVHVYDDFGVGEILDVLYKVSKMDHTNNDCLVIAVMSHGTNGKLYASDGTYSTDKLWNQFDARNCPTLAAKPKLFFIQACRGKSTDPGATIQYETDSRNVSEFYTIPVMADILIMYATVEGYYAWRDLEKGSCFIQSLVQQLEKHHDKKDLLSILTFVNRQVAIEFTSFDRTKPEFHEKKEMSSIVSMLTRLLYFQ